MKFVGRMARMREEESAAVYSIVSYTGHPTLATILTLLQETLSYINYISVFCIFLSL